MASPVISAQTELLPHIVRMRGIVKRFPGVIALDNVGIDLRPGEVHALTGENGSGKSTLASLLYGYARPSSGQIEVDGVPVRFRSPADARELGIAAISQELSLAPHLTVAENILMDRLPTSRFRTVSWRAAYTVATAALARIGADIDVTSRVGELRLEQQQQVEIARALSFSSRVLILDEATSSLSEDAAERLLRTVKAISSSGVAVLLISHRLPEIYRVASSASVLRDGRLVGTVTIPGTSEEKLISMMVGRDLGELFVTRPRLRGPKTAVLEARELNSRDGALKRASFQVHEREILGIAGLAGSGKEELGLILAGEISGGGQIRLRGVTQRLRAPHDALTQGIAYVPHDRKRYALLPTCSVRANLSIAWDHLIASRAGFIRIPTERALAKRAITAFGIKCASIESRVAFLSGGNQQKCVLARCLETRPKVLVLSEPTRGIDIGAKQEVYRLIAEAATRGTAIVLISSELPELLRMTDRVGVMHEGELRAVLHTSEASEELLTRYSLTGERTGSTPDDPAELSSKAEAVTLCPK